MNYIPCQPSPLIENAKGSIRIGIEDYFLAKEKHDRDKKFRMISALRNIYAGILIMFKERLLRLSTDRCLIFLESDKKSNEAWLNKKTLNRKAKTVYVKDIKKLFEKFHVDYEEEYLDQLNQARNELEHFSADVSDDYLEELLVKAHHIILDFINGFEDETIENWIDRDQWERIEQSYQLVQEEKKRIEKEYMIFCFFSEESEVRMKHSVCPHCSSSLLIPTGKKHDPVMECCYCKEKYSPVEIIKSEHDEHYNIKSGSGPTLGICPECYEETLEEDGDEMIFKCDNCGYVQSNCCEYCGSSIPIEEVGEGDEYCGYCRNMLSKDD